MKKKFLALLMASILLLLAACNPSTETGTSGEGTDSESEEKKIVTFWHSMSGKNQEALNSIVEDFNTSQDSIQVNAEFQGTYEESLPKFHSVGGTEDAPTIIQVQEIGTMSMINSGNIEPIQTFIDAEGYDMSILEENIINYYKVDDKFYSMPFNSSTPVMYYNKDAFKAAGLDSTLR